MGAVTIRTRNRISEMTRFTPLGEMPIASFLSRFFNPPPQRCAQNMLDSDLSWQTPQRCVVPINRSAR